MNLPNVLLTDCNRFNKFGSVNKHYLVNIFYGHKRKKRTPKDGNERIKKNQSLTEVTYYQGGTTTVGGKPASEAARNYYKRLINR